MCLQDDGYGPSTVETTLHQINAIISDQAFVKDGSNYVSSQSINMGSDDTDGKVLLKLTFKFNGTTYSGLAADVSLDMGDQGGMSINLAGDATGSGSLKMKFDVPSVMTMDLSASFTYSDTTQTPAAQPPADSTVVPINGLMSGFLPTY